ncbi:hypothetical protein BU24DRAFT_226774 [Aaosphaeria arxii CBS 175.79]|uniref:Zn(2)-C6 fungal-type domain-containing protein n=1 Tax=Aaosphaeria arxii CBS 175.79 TaxID=1450172 RepID=A0A6A5XQ33_9PLEO|nr:uncharacterized protein BU24DRAFT_226774 [Aaosphaeria arxii CBS 175.79]KAF2015016.1 hypothetical protein BU24DRAFT_226774 [Aaosphaeria arxii CBS 175.79]
MEASAILGEIQASAAQRFQAVAEDTPISRSYHPRHSGGSDFSMIAQDGDMMMNDVYPSTETTSGHEAMSPTKTAQPKHISFVLLLPQSPQHRARLPMRVNIFPHDTTDSIITTVKNFYGLYERRGVVFEDQHGTTLIARYENFDHNMVVYVRITAEEPEIDDYSPDPRHSASPRRPRLGDAFQMLPPSLTAHQDGRLGSRTTGRHSQSPQPGRGRRSASASTNNKSRVRPAPKSRGTSSHGSFADINADAGNFSDSDGGNASVTSSRRSRKEQVASADISVENIVEGGRRKRAKFDSSELPLFVPPQVPMTASLSSVSPQRRISSHNGASPYSVNNNQHTFSYPLPSPQSYGQGEASYLHGLATPYSSSSVQMQGYKSRTRGSGQYVGQRHSGFGGEILPTPDPTLGSISVISDEDVARQLMRLGDASNFSTHGRTSTSTLDDALSGKAEAPSSDDESDNGSEDQQELPGLPFVSARSNGANGELARAFDSGSASGDEYDDNHDDSFKGESDEIMPDEHHDRPGQANGVRARSIASGKSGKSSKPRAQPKSKSKSNAPSKPPMSPASLPPQSRKQSVASITLQAPLGADEEDLSSKPRCQRCRKSKKGCDRQRPCGRCKDAGIGIEGCISEDEGNGRKGRYGRHMGVTVKKTGVETPAADHDHVHGVTAAPTAPPLLSNAIEKSKKRKR